MRYLELQTIQDVADEGDITSACLSRLFKRSENYSAYQYRLRRRINYAAGLLMNDGILVGDVAARKEMTDAFQFSRAFRRVFGIPPQINTKGDALGLIRL